MSNLNCAQRDAKEAILRGQSEVKNIMMEYGTIRIQAIVRGLLVRQRFRIHQHDMNRRLADHKLSNHDRVRHSYDYVIWMSVQQHDESDKATRGVLGREDSGDNTETPREYTHTAPASAGAGDMHVHHDVRIVPLPVKKLAKKHVAGTEFDIGLTDDQRMVLRMLIAGQLEMETFLYTHIDKLCILLRATISKLFRYADQIDYSMLFDEDVIEVMMIRGAKWFKPRRIEHKLCTKFGWFPPYNSIYGKFSRLADVNMYWRPKSWLEARQGPQRLSLSKDPDDMLTTYNGMGLETIQEVLYKSAQEIQSKAWEKNKKNYTFDYERFENMTHPFRESIRLLLTKWIILGKKELGGCELPIDQLIDSKQIDAFFPASSFRSRDYLKASWLGPFRLRFSDENLFELKEYVGYKIGFYFAFQSHFVDMLLIPSVVGAIIQILDVALQRTTANAIVGIFAFYVCCWSGYMHETWKDRERSLAFSWGASHQVGFIPDRHDFEGKYPDPVTGRSDAYFPESLRREKVRNNLLLVVALICVTIGVVSGIYAFRIVYLSTMVDPTLAQMLASGANAVQIEVFKSMNAVLAPYLTRQENHRTDREFANAIISKLFAFDFFNTFSSFFYIAFVAMNIPNGATEEGHVGECGAATCMTPLRVNLAIIFIVMATWGNVTETVIPLVLNMVEEEMAEISQGVMGKKTTWLGACLRTCCRLGSRLKERKVAPGQNNYDTVTQVSTSGKETVDLEATLAAYNKRQELSDELERGLEDHLDTLYLDNYDPIEDLVADYTESMITFGFTVLFVPALPAVFLLAWLASSIELRSDAWKFLSVLRRPLPSAEEGIGNFHFVLRFIIFLGAWTNSGLVFFTTAQFSHWKPYQRVLGFFLVGTMLNLIQQFVVEAYAGDPESVLLQNKRTAMVVSRLVDRTPDDSTDDKDLQLDFEGETEENEAGVDDKVEVKRMGCCC